MQSKRISNQARQGGFGSGTQQKGRTKEMGRIRILQFNRLISKSALLGFISLTQGSDTRIRGTNGIGGTSGTSYLAATFLLIAGRAALLRNHLFIIHK